MKKKAVFALTALISSYSASLISAMGFFSTLPDGVDGDVRTAQSGDRVGEQFRDGTGRRQVCLQGDRFGSGGLDGGHRGVRIRFGRRTVVMDGDRPRAMGREIAGDPPAEVLRPAGDDDGFFFGVVRFGPKAYYSETENIQWDMVPQIEIPPSDRSTSGNS
jgi:hypothetical protein